MRGSRRRSSAGPAQESFDLKRFLDAQDTTIQAAKRELKNGKKVSHWVWWHFPQHVALGGSPTSNKYGIKGLGEAKAYLADDELCKRILELVDIICDDDKKHLSARRLFGPDDVKVRSSLTLFEYAARKMGKHDVEAKFTNALVRFYKGNRDPQTIALLDKEN